MASRLYPRSVRFAAVALIALMGACDRTPPPPAPAARCALAARP